MHVHEIRQKSQFFNINIIKCTTENCQIVEHAQTQAGHVPKRHIAVYASATRRLVVDIRVDRLFNLKENIDSRYIFVVPSFLSCFVCILQ